MICNDYVQSLGYGVGVGEFLPRPVANLKRKLMIIRNNGDTEAGHWLSRRLSYLKWADEGPRQDDGCFVACAR